MTKEEFKEMVERNEWHTDLEEAFDVIQTIISKKDLSWSWTKNSACKYIDIRIDMRDGGFVLMDRDKKRISLDDLRYQWKPEDDNE